MLSRLRFLVQLTRAHRIARRYFVTNGFDGALTMLGLNMGFYASGDVDLRIIVSACLGAAIALAASGLVSAYISESAERNKELKELEKALFKDLNDTDQGRAARLVPLFIAGVNGLAPFLIALVIISPMWLAMAGIGLPLGPIESSIGTAFIMLFMLGAFLGIVEGSFWLWSGLKTLLIAGLTAALILVVAN